MKSLELAEVAGVSYRQVDFWVRKGYIKERSPGGGSGFLRDFADEEVAVTMKMASLVRIGLKPEPAAEYARLMVEHDTDAVTVDGWMITELPVELAELEENITDVSADLVS